MFRKREHWERLLLRSERERERKKATQARFNGLEDRRQSKACCWWLDQREREFQKEDKAQKNRDAWREKHENNFLKKDYFFSDDEALCIQSLVGGQNVDPVLATLNYAGTVCVQLALRYDISLPAKPYAVSCICGRVFGSQSIQCQDKHFDKVKDSAKYYKI